MKHPVNIAYTSYAWLIDKDGNPVTGATAYLTVTVIDESDAKDSNPTVTEVSSSDAPGLYKASFTPDATGFWKVFWDSTYTDADIAGGEVIYVCDVEYDENGTYSYPSADATEKEISEQFTTAWSTLTRRRTHMCTQLDFNAIVNDTNAPNVTIRRYVKVDGSNWRKVDETTYNNATLVTTPCILIEPITTKQAYKITVQLSTGLNSGQNLPWAVAVKYEDMCA